MCPVPMMLMLLTVTALSSLLLIFHSCRLCRVRPSALRAGQRISPVINGPV
jgi:hypothetical protein